MDRIKAYRILLSCALAAVLVLLAFFVIKAADDALPDYINLVRGTEERFESAVPVTVSTESTFVECNAVSTAPMEKGMIHKTAVSIEGKVEGYYKVEASLFGLFPLKSIYVHVLNERESLIPGGQAVGIYMETDGLLVLGTGAVIDAEGVSWEPAADLVQTGDYILRLNDTELTSKLQMAEEMQKITDPTGLLTLRRDGEVLELQVPIIRAEDGTNKMGIWIRDDTMGIGTLTYVTEEGAFGALGHSITDADTGIMMELETGELYSLGLLTVKKGSKGNPGKLSGTVLRNRQEQLGEIYFNSAKGIYGELAEEPDQFEEMAYPIAWKQEIEEGMATILSGISGEIKEYAVEIEQVELNTKNTNKGMEIRVVDEALLELTGGIIQGMSGSPIIQDGKLVGAVTHVLVNDPTRGYGIFIENMLDAAG